MFRWAIFSIAATVLIWIGFWSNRKIKKAETSEEGFLLGAKEMGPFIAAGTLMATGYSG
jgi:sodium/proline symporter